MFDQERWRRRWPWLDHALSVHERFGAIGGGPLSSSLGLAGFLSLFPLLLVAIAVVGFVSSGNSDFAADLVEQLGLEGQAADLVTNSIETAQSSKRTATVIGVAGLLWAGLGVVSTLQAAVNAAWQTKGRGLRDKAVALAWLVGAGAGFLASMAGGSLAQLLPGPGIVAGVLLSLLVSGAVLLWAYSFLGNQALPWRAHVAGAVVVALGFEVLKIAGAYFVPRAVASSSALYGTIGVVFAVLAYLLLYARLFVYGAVVNVSRWEAAHGTLTVEIEVPRIEGAVPLTTTRGGAVDERVTDGGGG